MRVCKTCGKEKEIEKFRKQGPYYRHECKECYASKYRTGKPNKTRFKKGHIPWIKGKKFDKKFPKKIKNPRIRQSVWTGYNSNKKWAWMLAVKERDHFTCRECGSKENLHAHHIVPWKIDETKRFDIDNGVTLCRSCHAKEERKIEMERGQFNLKRVK